MIDIQKVADIVQTNCHISDANYAGNYSLCIFLLKMREYYRWEKRIPLSANLTKSDVGEWLSQREGEWEAYEEQDFQPLHIHDEQYDPFEANPVNALLNPLGYVYSSGLGVFGKPHFFVGELEQHQDIDGLQIYIANRELARDLVAPPAMVIGDSIFVRKESLRRFIWEKIEEWHWKNDHETPMARALAHYRTSDDDMEQMLDAMCDNEAHTAILHELGEVKANDLLGPEWLEILNQLPHSGLELKLRAIKDHLADNISTLPALVENENFPALHFYFANLTGMRKEIFPEAVTAYNEWVNSKNPAVLEALYTQGKDKWLNIANEIKQTYLKDQEVVAEHLEPIVNF
ncbi:MAG: hypothetical protein PVG89_15225 [Gammaproteobacteria bacterium]|jgi:hypothetical protein